MMPTSWIYRLTKSVLVANLQADCVAVEEDDHKLAVVVREMNKCDCITECRLGLVLEMRLYQAGLHWHLMCL
ncbi:hypothetical protein PR048_022490 [Dryococelus australis]|uniref:Uncharacterized protein n=1 Tax=Dryococelus australis TaxID=614101 RepID=A0ABQ9H167_9NEOP|nr:hypothetical protein PR048_022490 [Dryococelus australis]